jgi:RHS repeat-associated protein
VPALGLSGRGQNLALGLAYNSLVWSKTNTNEVTYDADRGWPAPGWSLGFGKIVGLNQQGSLLIEPDGTRRGFGGTVQIWGSTVNFTGKTLDGSFIDYTTYSYNGVINSATARYPDGTIIDYWAPANGAVYPTRITDANGNFISITYRNNHGPDIDTVYDTLGRVINFHYDSLGLLTSITTPDLGGGTRAVVRLQYQQADLGPAANYGFSWSMTTRVRNANPYLLRGIYFPGTSTGYWFGDPDSYSPYGMISKVAEQHTMGFSAASLDEQGSLTPGTTSQQTTHDYPTALGSLADAPTYSAATLTWEYMDTAASVTQYFVQKNATNPSDPLTPSSKTEVTLPTNTKTVQYSYRLPGDFKDGLVYQDETYDGAGNLLSSSKVQWEKGDYDAPRPVWTEVKDDRGQAARTEFTYAANKYNQTTEVRNYDYDGVTLLRRTTSSYENSANYINRHIFNLPTAVDVYGGDGVRSSRTEYEYDAGMLAETPDVAMHLETHNPYSPWYQVECDCWYEYNQWGWEEWVCHSTCSQTDYDPSTQYRGLVTKVTVYADAASNPAAGPLAETFAYDMTGNQIVAATASAEQVSTVYTINTQFAYPESQTRGAADPNSSLRVTTSNTYDFNTGLGLTATDADGRTTQAVYYQNSLRPQYNNMPTGARTNFEYDDTQLTVAETTELSPGGAVADKSVTYLNGLGLTRRVDAWAGFSSWDVVETKYDVMGRVWKKSMPYRAGSEQPRYGENFYDALGRNWKTVAPDSSETKTFFNEASRPDAATPGSPAGQTSRLVNAWGQERWGRSDALGRLVEVVEPDPNGNGTVATGGLLTTYAYNTNDNLVQINQGAQVRRFRYDSLERLTHQKLAEATATLNDAGQYVGPGGAGAQWSDTCAYDTRNNLTARTDARGVTTVYTYNDDPLNRLQSISFVVGAAHDASSPIAAAATVSYEYMGTGDKSRPYRVTTAGVRQDTLGYDVEGRVHELTSVMTSRPGQPMTTTYDYDALDRVTDVTYPHQYQLNNPSPSRRVIHHDYDVASRVSAVKVNGNTYASDFFYNAASQITNLKIGYGSFFTREMYQYEANTGLLQNQYVMNDGITPILSLTYDYLRAGTTTGRTGQVTKITNNIKQDKGRAYTYDGLGRLKTAAGGNTAAAPLWTQTYDYDRYGNRQSVTASGVTAVAGLQSPQEPKVREPQVEIAAAVTSALPEPLRNSTAAGERRATSDAPDFTGVFGEAQRNMLAASALLLDSPTNLQITSAADNQVSLSWSSTGANFRVERKASLSGTYALVGTAATTSFNDTNVSRGNAYLYRVCAANGSNSCITGYSSFAVGTAVTFADPTLTAQVTSVKAQHFDDLRLAVNAVRRAANLGDATWTDMTLTAQSTTIRAVHVQELRDRLNEALTALNITVSPFTDPVLGTGSGGTTVKKVHVDELRARSVAGRSNTPGDGGSQPVPTDGHATLAYDSTSNRVSTPGWLYDTAGNQIRVQTAGGVWQRMEYDAANRLVAVKTDGGATLASYVYADTNARMMSQEGGTRTYYVHGDAGVLAEYTEADGTASANSPQWSKAYVYMGERLLGTAAPNGSGGDYVEYHHPDRLGTRVVTNNVDASFFEQLTLPFGVALNAESTGVTSRRFTSYDRSAATGLDYALNRHYDSAQGRFTQIDPLGLSASNLSDPQSLNMYAYCGNDPVNQTDANGLFWGKLWRFLKKAFKWLAVAAAIAVAVLTIIYAPVLFSNVFQAVMGIISAVAGAAQSLTEALGLKRLSAVFGLIAAGAGFLGSLQAIKGTAGWAKTKAIFKAIGDGASLASKSLAMAGHTKLSQVFGLVSTAANFISGAIRKDKDANGITIESSSLGWRPEPWEVFKFARNMAAQIATMAGAQKVAGWLDVIGLAEDAYSLGASIFGNDFNKGEAGGDIYSAKPQKDWRGNVLKADADGFWSSYRKHIRLTSRVKKLRGLIGNVNKAFGRIEKGVALAH